MLRCDAAKLYKYLAQVTIMASIWKTFIYQKRKKTS